MASKRLAQPQAVRVAFVGGLDRLQQEIVPFGEKLGLEVVVHNGHTGGGGTARLVDDAARPRRGHRDRNEQSQAVEIARREAAKSGAHVKLLTSLEQVRRLTEIAQRAAA